MRRVARGERRSQIAHQPGMEPAAARHHHLGGAGTHRPIARATLRTVSATAVATVSGGGTRAASASVYACPNRSRPVLLGGGSAKNGSASSSASTASSTRPAAASSPSTS